MELWQAQSQRLKTHPAQLYAKFESKEVRLCLVCRLLCLLRAGCRMHRPYPSAPVTWSSNKQSVATPQSYSIHGAGKLHYLCWRRQAKGRSSGVRQYRRRGSWGPGCGRMKLLYAWLPIPPAMRSCGTSSVQISEGTGASGLRAWCDRLGAWASAGRTFNACQVTKVNSSAVQEIGTTFTALCASFVLVTLGMPPRLWGDSSMNMDILHRLSMTVKSVHLAICPMDSQQG